MLQPTRPIFTYQRLLKAIFKSRLKACQTLVGYIGPLRHLSSCSNYFRLIKSISRKQTCLCLGNGRILQPRTWGFIFFNSNCALKPGAMPSCILLVLFSDTVGLQECSFPLGAAHDHISVSFSHIYFPMQKSLKMMSRISSTPTRPVIRPRLVTAKRTPSAARARSVSRYSWYWARAATHCCRWALWRACVRVGAPNRGSPHLQRKLISNCEDSLEKNYKDALGRLPQQITGQDLYSYFTHHEGGHLSETRPPRWVNRTWENSNLQSLDTAVQYCEEVRQSFISLAGDQTDGRQAWDPSQLLV